MSGFASFDEYLALPRVQALALSPDGSRLVATVAELDDDRAEFVAALWELDPVGVEPARRLTRSTRGESGAVIAPDGAVLFRSNRGDADDDPATLWRLPVTGEAEPALSMPASVGAVAVARESGAVVVSSAAFAGSSDVEADTEHRKARKELKVSAILHEDTPIRYWDHDLGPDERRLWSLGTDGAVDLTPQPGRALDEASFTITPDGSTVLTSWNVAVTTGLPQPQLVAIDVASGSRTVLADDTDAGFHDPAVSRDGRWVVCVRERASSYDDPPAVSLWLVELATGEGRELLADPDVWPAEPVFAASAGTVYFTADERGHRPVFRLDVATGDYERVTATGHYTHVQVAADGVTLYALRDAWDSPPRPVRLDAAGTDVVHVGLVAPGGTDAPGPLERVSTRAADGATIEAWLALPEGATADSPVPLVLWMHGGPLGSWNGWSWRWNPSLLTGRGYAVLLPDPALSTGYGEAMIRRGWGQWGGAPFTDLMAITDAVVARPDIDATRTAAMGGSYGGYLANWVAGHTDRFRCLVTHASLWNMSQFHATTDHPGYWVREWGLPDERPERYDRWSPHHSLGAISTPMLVIHGDRDYRVPISEALRLWWDLRRSGVESSYLYFPDEGHWILKPGNARVWYETVWAWLDQHVLGEPWRRPELL